jgi:hypothetical protein
MHNTTPIKSKKIVLTIITPTTRRLGHNQQRAAYFKHKTARRNGRSIQQRKAIAEY